MYKKISLILIAFIIFVSSFAGLMSNEAFADEPSAHPAYPADIPGIASGAAASNLLSACYPSASQNIKVIPEVSYIQLPGDYYVASVSAITGIEKKTDTIKCKSIDSKFLSLMEAIGFKGKNPREVYCSMNDVESGVVVNASSACPASTGTGEVEISPSKATAAFRKKAETIHGYVAYYIGYKMLIQECGVTDKGTRSKDDGLGSYPQIGIVKEDGTIEVHAYELANADSVITMWNSGEGGTYKTECKNIITGHMGEKSDWTTAYAAYVKSKIKPPAASSGTSCDSKYKTELEKNACKEGMSHKDDDKYCDTSYPPNVGDPEVKKANAACKYGKNLAKGGGTGTSSSTTGSGVTTLPDGSTIELAPPETTGDGEGEEDQENCKIDYIGWVICPVVNTLASMSEGARARLVKMLTVDTKSILGDTSEGSVYSYWSKIRDYANILFVIFFLFVIYSQITGYGLDNYGIKRMLPKLIVGVIAVNVSFYICGLLIDLSNVVGSSAFNFISTAAVGGMPAGDWNDSDQGWISSIAAGALLLTVGYFALATVISVLLFVVITAVTTIFLLGVREAIIILCTVISPLAFAAMIMPNTEGLYKKWWNVFKASLMVFPMVGLVYGASNLAARILGASVEENDFILKSVITLLIFAPLPVVPKLVKSAVEIIGIGGLVAGAEKWMNKKRGAMTDKVGKWRENKLTSQFGKHRREKAQLRNAQIRGGTYRGRGGFVNPRNWRSGANRRLNAMSGDFGQKRKLAGSAAALAEDNERMKAANAWIADNNMSSDRLAEIATGFTRDKDGKKVAADLSGISSYQRRAAMQALAPHMTSKQASDLAEASASFGDASLQKEAANAIAESGAKKAPWLGGKQLEAIKQGTYNEEEAMGDYIKNKASGSGLANADADAVRRMVEFSTDQARHNADNSYMKSLMNARASLDNDPKTAGTVPASVRAEINKIPPLQQQQTHGASSSASNGQGQQNPSGSSNSGSGSGGPSPRSSTPPPNPGPAPGPSGGSQGNPSGSGQNPQNSTPPPKPSTPNSNSNSSSSSDSSSSSSGSSSSDDSSSSSGGGGYDDA
mgnify:CR=1 FL=1